MLFNPIEREQVQHHPISEWFTNPFDYQPHPLVRLAADEVASWVGSLDEGKMFGVLVVRRGEQVGFIAAFSGMLSGSYYHDRFTPPIFSIEQSASYKDGQDKLRAITSSIEHLASSEELLSAVEALDIAKSHLQEQELIWREEYREGKRLRAERRAAAQAEQIAQLAAESSSQKRRIKEQRAEWLIIIEKLKQQKEFFESQIRELKSERAATSLTSQRAIFEEFVIHNAKGEARSLRSIFDAATHQLPPSGSGECAAPKMLEYAYQHNLTPLAMGEFWLGPSPISEPRHAGEFYTSCSGKCAPILGFMLEGLSVEQREVESPQDPVVLFEDEHIILFDKPSGMLSVRGKSARPSLDEYMPNLHTVHRLDMDTSGVIIFAKSAQVKVALQRQFEERSSKKCYIALCQGEVSPLEGEISLPLRPDIEDRPRQVVDYEYGKYAQTRYRVIECVDGVSRVEFLPVTGRTHQLRVHAAHKSGLSAPIVGDRLYGRHSRRLCLHAQSLSFIHPTTLEELTITAPVPF